MRVKAFLKHIQSKKIIIESIQQNIQNVIKTFKFKSFKVVNSVS